MGGRKRPPPSRPGSKKARKSPVAVGRAAKKRRLDAERVGNPRRSGPGLDVLDDFAAFRVMHSNGGNAAALRQMEVFEWIGDAVIGELVARCLLSQFHHSPLSARVFRNLRLGVVTNQNLASVFDLVGFQRHTIETRQRKTKEKADVVEAVVGEIVVRLELQKRDMRVCSQLRGRLDELMGSMLHQHFKERRRVHQKAVMSGPLTVSFNAFSCLPQEHLDVETGELVVRDGVIEAIDGQVQRDSHAEEFQQKSFADLIEECEHDDKPRVGNSSSQFHAFGDASTTANPLPLDWDEFSISIDEPVKQRITEVVQAARLKLCLLHADHVLRSSREIFDVFKIYGMAVLAERVSLALAFPPLAFRHTQGNRGAADALYPSSLTTQRQSVLCMINMERCAAILGLAGGKTEGNDDFITRRFRANTLRAFIGYHSAIAAVDSARSVADDVAYLLQLLASCDVGGQVPQYSLTPRREPLGVLNGAVTETAAFMVSQVCDDLHQSGERPQPTQSPKLMLRQCDSETVENLFETLARQSADIERSSRAGGDRDSQGSSRRRKRKRSESNPDAEGVRAKPTANLTRFAHRRFLFCLEDLIILFAQRKTDECRAKLSTYEADLETCAGEVFRKWEVSTSTLTLALPQSFHRLLLHDLSHFHALVSTSKTTRDGTRITQLRLPLHYAWTKIQRRVTTEEEATG